MAPARKTASKKGSKSKKVVMKFTIDCTKPVSIFCLHRFVLGCGRDYFGVN
jgi:hypothetical protein